MMEKYIRIEIYKLLRKLGANRAHIEPDAELIGMVLNDEFEWMMFMFLLESRFGISLEPEQEERIHTVEDAIAEVCSVFMEPVAV